MVYYFCRAGSPWFIISVGSAHRGLSFLYWFDYISYFFGLLFTCIISLLITVFLDEEVFDAKMFRLAILAEK